MTAFLRWFFVLILVSMLGLTIAASLDRGVFQAGSELWPDPWFRATLADAYFGFLTVFVWVAYRERTWRSRAVWFLLFMVLGNIAIAAYALLQLRHLRPGDSPQQLFLRRSA